MKKYDKALEVGLELIYDGEPRQWCNPKTGKINEVMKRGAYRISRITYRFVYVCADRKNGSTEHQIDKQELERDLYALEFEDLTTPFALMFCHKNWYINDKELINSAKAYNKRK